MEDLPFTIKLLYDSLLQHSNIIREKVTVDSTVLDELITNRTYSDFIAKANRCIIN